MAHNVIPHCHQESQVIVSVHSHLAEHHEHATDDHLHEGHEHVSHNDHLDESLFDFIVCALSAGEQPDSEHHFLEIVPTDNTFRVLDFKLSTELPALLVAVFTNSTSTQCVPVFSNDRPVVYDSIDRATLPQRGPPVFS